MRFITTAVPAGKKTAQKKATAAVTKSSRVKKGSKKVPKSNPKPNPKAGQSPGSVHQQGFRFLDLIPEIRNFIYELALQSDETIIVDRELKLPPLLATCTQIRDEACSIWYRDNQFRAEVNNCDAAALNKWSQHCCTVGQRDYFDVRIFLEGYIYWSNLLDWCRAVWKDDKARVLVYEADLDDDYRIVCEAHHIAMRHKGKPWGKCVRALEDMRIEEEEDFGNWAMFEDDTEDEEE